MIKFFIQYLLTHYIQLSKFLFVGFLTFFINLGFFHFFYASLAFNYKIAITISYVISVICHFMLHRFFTFKNREQAVAHHLVKYGVMLALNYGITLGAMWMTINILVLSPYFGLVFATAITAVTSFFTMKYFVFRLTACPAS